MRLEKLGNETFLIMSRRNLESLLAKLDGFPPDSACTIGVPQIYKEEFGEFWVKAEEDDVHYSHPSRQGVEAGPMHPYTEKAIRGGG